MEPSSCSLILLKQLVHYKAGATLYSLLLYWLNNKHLHYSAAWSNHVQTFLPHRSGRVINHGHQCVRWINHHCRRSPKCFSTACYFLCITFSGYDLRHRYTLLLHIPSRIRKLNLQVMLLPYERHRLQPDLDSGWVTGSWTIAGVIPVRSKAFDSYPKRSGRFWGPSYQRVMVTTSSSWWTRPNR